METKTSRLRLEVRGKPYWHRLTGGVSLGYRRTTSVGTWSVRLADGKQGNTIKRIASADDLGKADGKSIMTFAQARDAALRFSGDPGDDKPKVAILTLADVVEAYRLDLIARNGYTNNATRLLVNLGPALLKRPVELLDVAELRRWRDDLAKRVKPSSVNRLMKCLKAALNLAATKDESLNKRTWELGLKAIPDATVHDNIVLPESTVFALIDAAYSETFEFGLMVETLAMTGARFSQIARCQVRDLLSDRLMIPSSLKGVKKTVSRVAVPIPDTLVVKLRVAAAGRAVGEPLALRPSGLPWEKDDLKQRFKRIVKKVGEDPTRVTSYALRHTHITSQLLAGLPVQVVSKLHDTSASQIEKHYAATIASFADDIVRATMMVRAPSATVLPIRGGGQ